MSTGAGLRLAIGTFTRIPSGEVSTSPGAARAALLLAPLAVLPLATLVALVGASVELGVPPLVAAALGLAVLAHGSRGMHLDGLADVVDGFGAGWDRERALEVMRRGDVGPMGAIALVLVLLIQAAAAAHVLGAGWRGALVVGASVVLSRAVGAAVCIRGTTPAPGSRLGAAFVGTVPPVAAVLLLLVLGLLVGVLAGTALGSLLALVLVVLAAILTLVTALVARVRATRTFGGVGGDLVGACIELSLTLTLVLLTVV